MPCSIKQARQKSKSAMQPSKKILLLPVISELSVNDSVHFTMPRAWCIAKKLLNLNKCMHLL